MQRKHGICGAICRACELLKRKRNGVGRVIGEPLRADIGRVDAKLNNPNFMARAPEEVVEEEKEKREEAVARKAKIAEALERLKGAT